MDATVPQTRILVVDDEEPLRKLLITALQRTKEYEIFEAADGLEAQKVLSMEPMDLVITDLVMPSMGGDVLMHWAKEHYPHLMWIILTGQGTMTDAMEAVRMGAFDFVLKGTDAVSTLLPRVRNAVQQYWQAQETQHLHARIEQQNVRLREQVARLDDACQLLSQQAETIQEDFFRAAGIQRALLPREPPMLDGVAVDAIYRPCDRVGGDLYDVVRLDDHRLGVCVADAAGHGVAAAMLAVVFKSRLRLTDPQTSAPRQPQEVFEDLNEHLVEECRAPRMFVSAVYCLFDTATREATIASAGHPPALIHRSDGRIERIPRSGPALGLAPGAQFTQTRVTLQPGERVLFYTDGLFQTLHGKPSLTIERISEILAKEKLEGIDLLRKLLSIKAEGPEMRQEDDITLLVLTLAPVASQLDNGGPSELTAPGQPGAGRCEIALGRTESATAIRLQGYGDWTYATTFHQACISALDEGLPLVLDLASCQSLDSTFLGTIHELVSRADHVEIPIRLQGASPKIAALFEELGMARVLSHLATESQPLPERMVTLQEAATGEASQQRILRAHETLAALNEHNREQFEKVIECLRKETVRKPNSL
jgi:anti-anti-sigma factor